MQTLVNLVSILQQVTVSTYYCSPPRQPLTPEDYWWVPPLRPRPPLFTVIDPAEAGWQEDHNSQRHSLNGSNGGEPSQEGQFDDANGL